MALAVGRVYGNTLVRMLLTAYVEVMRGTPVLLQLFVIYYGLSAVVRLPAFIAALLGLGLNYAAYESEIYRSALEAVPRGQLEAARILGFTERQILRLVRGPQAFRLALAPMTNDFVALLKDSSLVSVITVVELTKLTQIFAANVGSWVVPGLLCAGLYLAMSLPLARLARYLEETMEGADIMTRVMELRGLRLNRGTREVLCGVDLAVAPGEMLALMGLSGSGKTTVLRTVAGLEGFDGGDVLIDGVQRPRQLTDRSAHRRLDRKVGMVFQFHFLFEHLTAIHNVWLAPVHVYRVARPEAERRAQSLLDDLGVGHRAKALPRSSRAARRSAWPSPVPWPSIRRCCSWTSRRPRSIPRVATSWATRYTRSPRRAAPSS
jgi:polar amino acid transport system substrate-binding protein